LLASNRLTSITSWTQLPLIFLFFNIFSNIFFCELKQTITQTFYFGLIIPRFFWSSVILYLFYRRVNFLLDCLKLKTSFEFYFHINQQIQVFYLHLGIRYKFKYFYLFYLAIKRQVKNEIWHQTTSWSVKTKLNFFLCFPFHL
jgi:hypothetical protein